MVMEAAANGRFFKMRESFCDCNRSDKMSISNTPKLKNHQFIRAFQSDRFTPDLPMFVNTKTISFILCRLYLILLFSIKVAEDYLFGKECSFGLQCVSFVDACPFVCVPPSLLSLRVRCRI